MHTTTILAADTGLFQTQIGHVIEALLKALALIVLLIGAAKAISSFTAGTPGKGAKIILGTAVVCSFLFNPSMAESLINFFSNIVGIFISSGDTIVDGAKNVTNSTPTTLPIK